MHPSRPTLLLRPWSIVRLAQLSEKSTCGRYSVCSAAQDEWARQQVLPGLLGPGRVRSEEQAGSATFNG